MIAFFCLPNIVQDMTGTGTSCTLRIGDTVGQIGLVCTITMQAGFKLYPIPSVIAVVACHLGDVLLENLSISGLGVTKVDQFVK